MISEGGEECSIVAVMQTVAVFVIFNNSGTSYKLFWD